MASYEQDHRDFSSRWLPVQTTVRAYVRSLIRDAQHAEDVIQEVALVAHHKYDQYDPTRPFVGWVLGIARYQILAHFKKSKRDRHVFRDDLLESIEKKYVAAQPQMNARAEALEQCMQKLPHEMSAVIAARYQDGLDAPRIAERLGGTATAINTMLYRARKLLKDCIEKRLRVKGGGHAGT